MRVKLTEKEAIILLLDNISVYYFNIYKSEFEFLETLMELQSVMVIDQEATFWSKNENE